MFVIDHHFLSLNILILFLCFTVVFGLDEIDKNKMYAIISRLVDGSRFREFKKNFGGNLITGYGILNG